MRQTLSLISIVALLSASAFVTQSAPLDKQKMSQNDRCMDNAMKLMIAVVTYMQEHNEQLPPMKSAETFRHAIQPYLKPMSRQLCPITKKAFFLNPDLSDKKVISIKNVHTTWCVRDAKPHQDGTYLVEYLDGHCVRVKKPPVPSIKPAKNPPKKK